MVRPKSSSAKVMAQQNLNSAWVRFEGLSFSVFVVHVYDGTGAMVGQELTISAVVCSARCALLRRPFCKLRGEVCVENALGVAY